MVDLTFLFSKLKDIGLNFYTGVPDSLLNDFCLHLANNIPNNKHIMAANEGNAISIAAGYHMATNEIPIVYMQNSGIGNAMNPLLSLADTNVYSIPMILLIGWRGDPSIIDHCQHKRQGELTTKLMDDMGIPYQIIDNEDDVIEKFIWAKENARETLSPTALIVKKNILSQKEKKQYYIPDYKMSREEVISCVINIFKDKAIYLATTGRTTRELHEQISINGLSHNLEFLNVGAMGHLSSIGLGIAVANPHKRIIIFDGDAAAVMHMGSLATNCRYKARNMIHIVLNNGVNESVGGQESAGRIINLTGIANACGYNTPTSHIDTKDELQQYIYSLNCKTNMPTFIDVHIRQGIRPDLPPLKIDHINNKKNFMLHLMEQD